jgi:hypothetical protein
MYHSMYVRAAAGRGLRWIDGVLLWYKKPPAGIDPYHRFHFSVPDGACLESGPNDSTRVRRLTGILRRARVKIFILAYGRDPHTKPSHASWFLVTQGSKCIG